LAIRAGSVHELGTTTGVAHFVEHMLFNGTEQFPENELIATLRSFGAAFGADVNAWTGYDATAYQLTVPNADETVELGLTVLEQWLSHATIDPQQVEDERGVILDEWRVRTQSPNGRLFAATEPMFLRGTPYEGRAPIGTTESIADVSVAELREFYDRYYRPDNAALVVVGDIDVDEIEADIERLFGDAVPRSDEPPVPIDHRFDLDLDPEALIHADPDQQTVDVEVTFPLPAVSTATTAGARAALLDAIAIGALLRRLEEDVVAGRAPFDDVVRGSNSFVASLDAPGLYAFTDADRAVDTLRALLDEFERARRFGFGQDELDVARESIRAGLRSRYDGRESTQDRDYADTYVDDFLTDSGFPSIEDEFAAVSAILDAITPEALDLRFRTRLANTAPHVIISTPEVDADRTPSVDEVLAIVAAAPERDLQPRDSGRELPSSLMSTPAPVEPVSADDVVGFGDALFDPLRLEFANGVTVIVNTNGIVEGQVFMQGASRGGLSLVADADVVDALYATEIVTSSGVGDFDAAELDRILAGADVSFDAWLQPYSEHVGGVAATADLEVLLQLIHLAMTEPRADEVALRQVQSRYGPTVDDPSLDPGLVVSDTLLDARYPDELRYAVLPTPEQFATLDLEGVRRVWAERFQNVDDWVFVLSGDLDIDVATALAGAYLGTLPTGVSEEPIDIEDPPPPGVVRRAASAGTGDTASVTLLYTAPADSVTPALRAAADVVTELVSARLIDVVRERLGDSYSPSAFVYLTFDPEPAIETYVSVTGAPDRIDALGDLVAGELATLAGEGAEAQEYVNAFAQVEERYRFVDNWEFVTELLTAEIEPAQDLDSYLLRAAALANLGNDDIDAFVRALVPADQYIQVTVTPR
jgi:zinc protease